MHSETPTPATDPALIQKKNPGIVAYIAFALAVAFFSGLLITDKWWGIFDYTVLLGDFGSVVAKVTDKGGEISTVMSNFRGKGGSGAIDGFMFALALVPTIMLATAMIAVFEHYGALNAAERLLNPILRPLLGLPAAARSQSSPPSSQRTPAPSSPARSRNRATSPNAKRSSLRPSR